MDGSAGGTRFLGAELRRGSMDLVLRDYVPAMELVVGGRGSRRLCRSVDGWDVVYVFDGPSVQPRYAILAPDFNRCVRAVSAVPRVLLLTQGRESLLSTIRELLRVEFAERKDLG